MKLAMIAAKVSYGPSALYHLLLCVIVVTSSLSGASAHCPARDDVNRAVHHCLRDYTAHLQNIQRTEIHFFAGVDVETLRTLCSHFKSSMQCVTSLQNSCPESHHHSIDVALRPYIAMFDMCYTQKTFIEDYAMSQNCLYNQRDQSENCFKQFLINTANHQYHASRDRQSAVNAYCRSLTELTSCVRIVIRDRCHSSTAAKLVEILVPLSAELSYKCALFSSHPSESKVRVTTPSISYRAAEPYAMAGVSGLQHHRSPFCIAPVVCILLVHLLFKFITRHSTSHHVN